MASSLTVPAGWPLSSPAQMLVRILDLGGSGRFLPWLRLQSWPFSMRTMASVVRVGLITRSGRRMVRPMPLTRTIKPLVWAAMERHATFPPTLSGDVPAPGDNQWGCYAHSSQHLNTLPSMAHGATARIAYVQPGAHPATVTLHSFCCPTLLV